MRFHLYETIRQNKVTIRAFCDLGLTGTTKSAVKTECHSVFTAIILMLKGYFSKIEVIK